LNDSIFKKKWMADVHYGNRGFTSVLINPQQFHTVQNDKMCSNYSVRSTVASRRNQMQSRPPNEEYFPRWKKFKKMIKCSKCGRKVQARISFCHDGCCMLFSLPPHKKKHWWKRRKKHVK
jgi:hypothetical protein